MLEITGTPGRAHSSQAAGLEFSIFIAKRFF
jgi:hypothetical protein